MTDLKEIVDALLTDNSWPWRLNKANEALEVIKTGYEVCEFTVGAWDRGSGTIIASSPIWLAQLVVGWVEERAQKKYYDHCRKLQHSHSWETVDLEMGGTVQESWHMGALRNFDLDPEKFAELKRRLENSFQNG